VPQVDNFVVTEIGTAALNSAEGELPWRPQPGETYRYADLSGPELVRTYTGPKRIAAPENAHSLREVVKSGDFEAVLTWVIGLDDRRPFAVTRSADGIVVTIG